MEWQDFFYFNKGERRALTLLSILIVWAWGLLWWTERAESEPTPEPVTTVPVEKTDTIQPRPVVQSQGEAIRQKMAETTHRSYVRTEKFPVGTVVELNGADTVQLKKVPSIGSTFARRIVKYRDLLGGFSSVDQLGEVYGIDEERFAALHAWFRVDTTLIRPLLVNKASIKELVRHPYLSYPQAKAIYRLVQQKGQLQGWENLRLLEEFSESDRIRLLPYLSFE